MENNNGKGIFYGVIGVATLVVAIIGATFAFFSATATSNNVIVGNTAEAAGLNLAVEQLTESTNENMIPLNVNVNDGEKDTVDQFANALASGCVDSNGNNVCAIYSVTVTNNSTTAAVTVRGELNLDSNAKNMKWRLLSSKTAALEGSTLNAKGSVAPITVGANTGGSGFTAASKQLTSVDPGNTATYYLMVWLEEMGTSQEGDDQAKSYTGTVTFNAVDATGNTSGLTATFTS